MKHFYRIKSDFVCNVCMTIQKSGFVSQYDVKRAICDECVVLAHELCIKGDQNE